MKTVNLGRLAAYFRVSSEEQKQGQSVEGQQGFVRNWCRRHELHLALEFTDEDEKGEDEFHERVAGRDLYRAAQRGEFDNLVVFAVDRLGRSSYAILHFFHSLRKLGIRIVSATEDFDPDEGTGQFLIAILAGKSQADKLGIRQRTESGKANWQSVDDTYTGGGIPFGYLVERRGKRRYYIICRDRIPMGDCSPEDVILYVFHRCVEGTSSSVIAAELNARSVTTCWVPGDIRYHIPSRSRWNVQRVEQILRNPFYKGTQLIGDSSKRKKVVREEAHPHKVPAIVSETLFLQVQERLKANHSLSERATDNFYLLRGKVTCLSCGKRYCGGTSVGAFMPRSRYYRCNAKNCRAKWLDAALLEEQVKDDILWILTHADHFVQEIQSRMGTEENRISQYLDEAAALDRTRAELGKVESEYLRMRAVGLISTDAKLQDLLREVGVKEEALMSQAAELREKAQHVALADQQLRAAQSILTAYGDRAAAGFNDKEWQQLVALLVDRIEVETISVVPPPPRKRGERGRKQAIPNIYYQVDLLAVPGLPTRGWLDLRALNNQALETLKKRVGMA